MKTDNYRPALMLDSHVDTLHRQIFLNTTNFDFSGSRPEFKLDLPRLKYGGINAMFWAVFTKQMWGVAGGRERWDLVEKILEKLSEENKWLRLSSQPQEVFWDAENNKISITLALENGCIIDHDLDFFKHIFECGVRYITLCHNKNNQICDSCTDEPYHNGLSEFGKKLIKKMNKVGCMIDISHASDKAAADVLEISELPIIASHSNAKNICDHPRNLNDYLLEKIAINQGVVQVSVLPRCLPYRNEGNPSLTDFMMHVDYIAGKFGTNFVGIGTDFDGGGGIPGFNHAGDAGNVTAALLERNYTKEEIDKIWGLNFMRVYQNNFGGIAKKLDNSEKPDNMVAS